MPNKVIGSNSIVYIRNFHCLFSLSDAKKIRRELVSNGNELVVYATYKCDKLHSQLYRFSLI